MKRAKKMKKVLLLMIIVFSIEILLPNDTDEILTVEDVDISSGIGIDMKIDNLGNPYYSVPISLYGFSEEENIISLVHTGTGKTFSQTNASRQLESNRKVILGFEKVVVIGEDLARYGLNKIVDGVFANPTINDLAIITVCKGEAETMLNLKIRNFPSSIDYIEGLLENASKNNFFTDNYKLLDMFIEFSSEGRNLVLPYIEIMSNSVEISGMALFKKDKLVEILNVEEAKVLNILREKKSKGSLSIINNTNESIDFLANVTRKVKCEKSKDKYNFTIDLFLKGNILSNTLYKDLEKEKKVLKDFEDDMSLTIEQMCDKFIKKMQNDYKIDCLNLGMYAVATTGRKTGVNWDQIICDSDIKVNVKIIVENIGVGRYGSFDAP